MSIEGVDYADSRPSASALKAAGKHFAVRYGGPGRASKQLTASEADALRATGIDIVANAEGAASGFKGKATGRTWAQQALDHFGPLGMPEGRPVYFSVDWDAGSADWAGIDAALSGAAGVLGAGRVGVYGSYDTVAHCKQAGSASWFWQTYAWSGGKWHPAAHLQQYKNGVTIGGADCDLDRAMTDDYGQWGVSDVSEAEVTSALTKFFSVGSQPVSKGGLPESKIGHDASSQGVPDTISGGTITLYGLIGKIGTQVLLARKDLADLAGRDLVDEDAIAASVLMGLTPERLGAAIVAAGLTPSALVAAIPDDLAEQVLALLGEKLRPSQ
jgi:hypothetical protein